MYLKTKQIFLSRSLRWINIFGLNNSMLRGARHQFSCSKKLSLDYKMSISSVLVKMYNWAEGYSRRARVRMCVGVCVCTCQGTRRWEKDGDKETAPSRSPTQQHVLLTDDTLRPAGQPCEQPILSWTTLLPKIHICTRLRKQYSHIFSKYFSI